MRNFLVGFLWFLLQVAVAIAVVAAVVTLGPKWWARWDAIEPLLGLIGVLAAGPGVYWFLLPRYSAFALHREGQWAQSPLTWSPRTADELAAKAAVGSALGRFAKDGEALIPVAPEPHHTEVVWFGAQRGIYRIYAVEMIVEGGLVWGPKCPKPDHQTLSSPPPLGWDD